MLNDPTLDLPPVYTAHTSTGNELKTTIISIFQLFKSAVNSSMNKDNFNNIFRVYHLDKLFMELKNACHSYAYPDSDDMAIPSVAIATDHLTKHLLDTIKAIGCTFHEKLENSHICSNYIVCKWIYIFSIHCCHYFNIELTSGCHYDFNLFKTEISVQLIDNVKSFNSHVE